MQLLKRHEWDISKAHCYFSDLSNTPVRKSDGKGSRRAAASHLAQETAA
uniref:Uncharacterized protein n=1 Tax=Parascaris equorum TaxID=6256 RepID=A0A914S4A3_PAREQ